VGPKVCLDGTQNKNLSHTGNKTTEFENINRLCTEWAILDLRSYDDSSITN
jgi:hypothetical protein